MRSRSSMRGVPTLLVIASMLCVSLPFTFANAAEDASQAASLLSQGRSLMRKSNAEQALGLLEQALKMYTQAGDAKGAAAAHDALGDLYNRQGQYEVALQHYKGAEQGFKSSQDAYDANLMMAKVGDMQLQRGKREDARYAYSQMDARRPPDPNPLGVANKAKGLFGKMKSVATSQPSLSTGSQLSSTSTEIMGARDTYRRFIIYSVYELGIGRIDYLNNQLDDAK